MYAYHTLYLHVYVYMVIFLICVQNYLAVGYDGLKRMKPTWRPIMQQRCFICDWACENRAYLYTFRIFLVWAYDIQIL